FKIEPIDRPQPTGLLQGLASVESTGAARTKDLSAGEIFRLKLSAIAAVVSPAANMERLPQTVDDVRVVQSRYQRRDAAHRWIRKMPQARFCPVRYHFGVVVEKLDDFSSRSLQSSIHDATETNVLFELYQFYVGMGLAQPCGRI